MLWLLMLLLLLRLRLLFDVAAIISLALGRL
jgi:hypothetical protein